MLYSSGYGINESYENYVPQNYYHALMESLLLEEVGVGDIDGLFHKISREASLKAAKIVSVIKKEKSININAIKKHIDDIDNHIDNIQGEIDRLKKDPNAKVSTKFLITTIVYFAFETALIGVISSIPWVVVGGVAGIVPKSQIASFVGTFVGLYEAYLLPLGVSALNKHTIKALSGFLGQLKSDREKLVRKLKAAEQD